jgi:hypothetical protein
METQRAGSEFRSKMAHSRESNEGTNDLNDLVENAIRRGQAIASNELPDFVEIR